MVENITKVSTYKEALQYLKELPKTKAVVFRDQKGLVRAKQLLSLLGSPQEKLKVVHIAGTSGKGSTAIILSNILKGHGFKVGLSLSPHVYDIRERCQINNHLIPTQQFCEYLNMVLPAVKKMAKQKNHPSYFEVLLALALISFVEQAVDYVVLETGMGGLLDATNTIERDDKVCVLNRIGYDHTEILGESLEKIALQKAGIIRPQNYVIALHQNPKIESVFEEQANMEAADLEWVSSTDIEPFLSGKKLAGLNYQLAGKHQKENTSLAVVAANHLAVDGDWKFSTEKLLSALKRTFLPGRFERVSIGDKTFILDGAHNQQKIEALLAAVQEQYQTKPFGLLFSLLESKKVPSIPQAKEVITTEFKTDYQDMAFKPTQPEELANSMKVRNPKLVITPTDDIKTALKLIGKSNLGLWIVTGSFFMLAETKKNLLKAAA